ncbi:PREDICTED: olfactory receptor 19-like [Elephantulus edwardii]|uniref:olfactory receptor 19-like n=1 Tax=Elephantulus edwardii TaxID=28737 RepID=UPI0003F09FFF|nr:PREDICTED: olfactory receptor 19-like [Elephantulus edwardii]
MEPENQTHVSEFKLLGLSEEADLQPLLFGVFLSMYLVTFTGNLLIILAILRDSHLHTPMYFFLSNLSLTDICFTSTTVPKMLLNIQMENKVITYEGCITQMYFFMSFGVLDTFLLTVMAYDRFVAICHPLHYTVIMSPKVCGLLLLVSWLLTVLHSLLQSLLILRYMEPENQTYVPEFTLLGLSEEIELQPLLFGMFLSMYLVTFTGNLLIILAIIRDSHLHTPMYFFLSNLSLTDICFTSTTVPKMLLNIQTENKVITYEGCITQMYFFMIFGVLDTFLLTVMAYDRFVAICHPLHYTVIMSPKVCGLLLLISWLSVVSLFYSTGFGVYLSSAASENSRASAIASVMYAVVTPMLNPFIYSLRNKDIKQALRNTQGGRINKHEEPIQYEMHASWRIYFSKFSWDTWQFIPRIPSKRKRFPSEVMCPLIQWSVTDQALHNPPYP